MGYLPDATIQAFKGTYNLGLFFRLGSTPPLCLWWGVSDIAAVIPGLDVAGTLYHGAGLMTEVPDNFEVLINGTADRVDFAMDGVDPGLANQIAAGAPSVVGMRVSFGFAPLDSRWQMLSDIIAIWEGTADFWSEEQPPQVDATKPRMRRISIATITGDASRALPSFLTYTDPIQHMTNPNDTFCSRVSRYYVGQIIKWPVF